MAGRIHKRESVYVEKARKALCEPNENGDFEIKKSLPKIITGYDPTYILQFGRPPEGIEPSRPINVEHGKDIYRQ